MGGINNENIGENLAFRWYTSGTKRPKGDEIADVWYNELKDYSWELPELNETRFAGHFTQMIWNSTEMVGFGVAADGQGKVTVVAQYYPAGNIKNDYERNVPPRMDGIIKHFPEEGAAFTIPRGSRKKVASSGVDSSMAVGEKSELLDQLSSDNLAMASPKILSENTGTAEDEGHATLSENENDNKSNDSSLSLSDVKITNPEPNENNLNQSHTLTNDSNISRNRIMLSLKRHQCTLDNLN